MNVSKRLADQVQALAKLGYSQRRIARIAGINRDTVSWILEGQAAGLRKYERPSKADDEQNGRAANDGQKDNGRRPIILLPNFRRPAQRCPGCGAKVHLPCLACGLRELSERQNQQIR